MLTSRDIHVLHLESSDVCQAACPQCARETDPAFDRSRKHNLSVAQLESILPEDLVSRLDKMFMCGNYGDPAANPNTLDIYQWFRSINHNIVLGMNTNGALQNTFWWHALAKILDQPLDYVVFSIDGLENTNADYRVGVNWRKLMNNVQSFIEGGGSAHWDMLVYQHNQHQIDACERLAREMGFKWFRAKVSRRPLLGRLQAPVGWNDPRVASGPIKCCALDEQSIYIDAQGRVSPCCWLGNRQRNFIEDFDLVQASWTTNQPNKVCAETCASGPGGSSFSNQWQKEVQLC